MASRLAEAQITAQERLRTVLAAAIERIWRSLTGYDEKNVPGWFGLVLPLVAAAQRQSVSLTEAYLARSLDRPPIGIDPRELIGASVRNGWSPEIVYRRPFVQHWTALKEGTPWEDSLDAALARAKQLGAMDVQLSQRATMDAVGRQDKGIFGFSRAADADACEYCRLIDGAYVKFASAMPLHPHCGCSLEPLTAPHPRAAFLPSGVAVHEHGELGPILGSPEHIFTTEAQALGY